MNFFTPMNSESTLPRTYDLIIYGATGFTGQQCVEYLVQQAPPELRWAIAGRSEDRLIELSQSTERPWIYADAHDLDSIDKMCSQTRVILSTAGPFALYSEPVVEACVRHQTHYVDITGETPWIKSLIDRFHERASANHTVILPACGFDSVPSDLGVWLLKQRGHSLEEVDVAFSLRGGLNGGTIASALNLAESAEARLLGKRTLLCPDDHQLIEQPYDPRVVQWDPTRERWLVPFFMGPVNTRIVRRSAALLNYGEQFTYPEWMKMTSGVKARLTLGTLGLFNSSLKSWWGRKVIRLITPKPGRGPSQSTIDEGFVHAHFIHRREGVPQDVLTLSIKGDPGNKVTCESVCEGALALVNNEQSVSGGVLTPMVAMGDALWRRLQSRGWELGSQYGAVSDDQSEEVRG